MEFVNATTLRIDRELSDLDSFALEFCSLLEKHTPYVIISGYVAILLGRARASEDIDILIPKLSQTAMSLLLADIQHEGFYCLNTENENELYSLLSDKLAVRFAKQETVIPNIELKFVRNQIDQASMSKKILVKLPQEKHLWISHLELQIAFKEIVLKSPKDMEDARHIRYVAQGHLDDAMIKEYKRMLRDFS